MWDSADNNRSITQIFQVREPLSRALSVYYFWGELFKLKNAIKENAKNRKGKSDGNSASRLGTADAKKEITRTFRYHGDEATPPPEDTAIAFAKDLPYNKGMPGMVWCCDLHF